MSLISRLCWEFKSTFPLEKNASTITIFHKNVKEFTYFQLRNLALGQENIINGMHINSILHFLENFYITTIEREVIRTIIIALFFIEENWNMEKLSSSSHYYEFLWELLRLYQYLLKHLPTLWNYTSLSIIHLKLHSSQTGCNYMWEENQNNNSSGGRNFSLKVINWGHRLLL